MKTVHITTLHTAAKTRPPGYLETCLKAGKTSQDGRFVLFDDETYAAIRRQFNPAARRTITTGHSPLAPDHSKRGLGDVIHRAAGPIGRAIHWPCLKGDGTTDLRPGSPCDRARRVLNKVKI